MNSIAHQISNYHKGCTKDLRLLVDLWIMTLSLVIWPIIVTIWAIVLLDNKAVRENNG